VFLDEHKLFKKFINNSRKYENDYGSISAPIFKTNDEGFIIDDPSRIDEASRKIYKSNKIDVKSEFLGNASANTKYDSYEQDCRNVKVNDEDHRISSRLVIENKYETESSSEGFYLYMFKEYAENLHPKPIYMKVEFNHAGIGKIIPFLIPMHWGEKQGTKSNKMCPVSALTLNTTDDINELKGGIPLSYVYAQTYIPLYAVYDFKNKEYGYVFDSRYVEVDCNGVLNLNLFEMKVMNEEEAPTEQQLMDIKLNRQQRAIINVNENQFDRRHFKYKME
jgi:hypothetical protein